MIACPYLETIELPKIINVCLIEFLLICCGTYFPCLTCIGIFFYFSLVLFPILEGFLIPMAPAFYSFSLIMNSYPKPRCLTYLSFASVLTPYYKEDVLYSDEELNKENEDGISILFYLKKIYPGNFYLGMLFVLLENYTH